MNGLYMSMHISVCMSPVVNFIKDCGLSVQDGSMESSKARVRPKLDYKLPMQHTWYITRRIRFSFWPSSPIIVASSSLGMLTTVSTVSCITLLTPLQELSRKRLQAQFKEYCLRIDNDASIHSNQDGKCEQQQKCLYLCLLI